MLTADHSSNCIFFVLGLSFAAEPSGANLAIARLFSGYSLLSLRQQRKRFELFRKYTCRARLLWVQDSGTYSSPRSWLAITSDSSFMRSGFRPQSELRPVLVRLISALRHRSALYRPLYHVCGPGHQRAMLIWRHPRLPPNYLGQSPVTFKTQGKGCVRYPN